VKGVARGATRSGKSTKGADLRRDGLARSRGAVLLGGRKELAKGERRRAGGGGPSETGFACKEAADRHVSWERRRGGEGYDVRG